MVNRKIKIVHVDDSEEQLDMVRKLLSEIDNVSLEAQFDNAEDALQFFEKFEVDLAILDVEMKEKDGFWLADKLKHLPLKIVFLTSFADYALKAFEACALHYILKPATKKNLGEVINRYTETFLHNDNGEKPAPQAENITELLDNYLNKNSYPKRVFINNLHKTTIIQLSEVIFISSKGSYTEFRTTDGQTHLSSKNLKFFDYLLAHHPEFLRIHRSNIVNKSYFKAIVKVEGNSRALMTDGSFLDLSSLRLEEIMEKISN